MLWFLGLLLVAKAEIPELDNPDNGFDLDFCIGEHILLSIHLMITVVVMEVSSARPI